MENLDNEIDITEPCDNTDPDKCAGCYFFDRCEYKVTKGCGTPLLYILAMCLVLFILEYFL